MSEMTLFLTRAPVEEFFYLGDTNEELDGMTEDDIGRLYRSPKTKETEPRNVTRYSGRWGSMLMIVGPKISSATIADPPPPGTPVTVHRPTDTTQIVDFGGSDLKLVTDGSIIESQTYYTTMERFRSELGYLGNHREVNQFGFVELHPDPTAPYLLSLGTGYDKLINMRAGTNGDYVKINKGKTQTVELTDKEQAILFHEAVHVGWLTGCISPRPWGDIRVFDQQDPNNPSAKAMREIFAALRAAPNQKGSLYVMDW